MPSRHYRLHRDINPGAWAPPSLGERVAYHAKVSGVPTAALVELAYHQARDLIPAPTYRGLPRPVISL